MPQTACVKLYSFSNNNCLCKPCTFNFDPRSGPPQVRRLWDFSMLLQATSCTSAMSFIDIQRGARSFRASFNLWIGFWLDFFQSVKFYSQVQFLVGILTGSLPVWIFPVGFNLTIGFRQDFRLEKLTCSQMVF